MREPSWLVEARRHVGTREVKGQKHEPKILQWWKVIRRGGIKDDETPWCAAFVGGCLEAVGVQSSRFESARSYLAWGVRLGNPAVGSIVVFERPGGGHVGFVVGRTVEGYLMVLGGNQGDAVCIAAFDRARVIDYRWPVGIPLPVAASLPILARNEQPSTNEA